MTSRTLVLLRHAKAEPSAGSADFERPLTDRGRRDSRAVGTWLLTEGHVPDAVICSPARRARQTWKAAVEVMGVGPRAHYTHRVYDANHPDELLEVIHGAPPDAGALLVVGHNPTLEMLSAMLDPAGRRLGGASGGMRTASIAVHSMVGEWAALSASHAPLRATATARG